MILIKILIINRLLANNKINVLPNELYEIKTLGTMFV